MPYTPQPRREATRKGSPYTPQTRKEATRKGPPYTPQTRRGLPYGLLRPSSTFSDCCHPATLLVTLMAGCTT